MSPLVIQMDVWIPAVAPLEPRSCCQVPVPMDAMRALASLDLVSARGLDTPGQGPELLSNSVGNTRPAVL